MVIFGNCVATAAYCPPSPLLLQICTEDKCVYRNPHNMVSIRKHYHATCSHIHQVKQFCKRGGLPIVVGRDIHGWAFSTTFLGM